MKAVIVTDTKARVSWERRCVSADPSLTRHTGMPLKTWSGRSPGFARKLLVTLLNTLECVHGQASIELFLKKS